MKYNNNNNNNNNNNQVYGKLTEQQRSIMLQVKTILTTDTPSTAEPSPIDNLTTRLNHQEQVLQKILNHLEQPKQQQATPPPANKSQSSGQKLFSSTWAGVAGQAAPPSTTPPQNKPQKSPKKPPPPPANNKLIVKTSLKANSFNPTASRERINSILKENKHPAYVSLVKLSANGNLVLETKAGYTAEQLQDTYNTWSNVLSASQPIVFEKWYKVVAHGVPTDFFADAGGEQMQLDALQEDIEEYNTGLKLATSPRWLTRADKRADKHHSSLVLAFKTPQDAKTALKNKLIVAGIQVKTTAYQEMKKPKQPTESTDSDSMQS